MTEPLHYCSNMHNCGHRSPPQPGPVDATIARLKAAQRPYVEPVTLERYERSADYRNFTVNDAAVEVALLALVEAIRAMDDDKPEPEPVPQMRRMAALSVLRERSASYQG